MNRGTTKNSILNYFGFTKSRFPLYWVGFLQFGLITFALGVSAFAQYPQNNYVGNQPNNNYYLANSTAFRQEIARMEINIVRGGKMSLPISQVPRLEKDDLIKIRLLDEPLNGLKPDQSNFDWTFLVAFINPGLNNDPARTVSEEINFRKRGWYKEHIIAVPFDSQPIFFLYPKPQYRSKIVNLINKNQEDIKKIGEKTIEIADAYGKIGMFLNELQGVVNRNLYRNPYSYQNYGSYNGYSNGFGYNNSFVTEQAIERIAKSFNIQLPSCWNGGYQFNAPGTYNNPYNYNGYYNPYYSYGMGNDLMGRIQCVARSVKVEDFDVSIGRMLQQGGVFVAAQLAQKYPQLAFWINIAASALDFIFKLTNRAPLKIIPTVVSTNELPNSYGAPESAKVSLFAESQPNDNGFVTAYPMVFHKWQANADPEQIDLPLPVLMDSCLHVGQNIIRTTDIINDWMSDSFNKNFQLTISTSNGFQRDFPLKKNVGFGGWELNLTKVELDTIPKTNLPVEAKITGTRGFNKIQSQAFNIQVASTGNWIVEPDSQKSFTVGGKRTVTLKNQSGNCRCLQAVVYKPAFGGEFLFDSNRLNYSDDGKEVSFEVDTKDFSIGMGQLELRQYGGDIINLNLNLYPPPPNVTNVKLAKGDNQAIVVGERLEQVSAIRINGKRAVFKVEAVTENLTGQPASNSQADMYMTQPLIRERVFVFEDSSRWQDSNSFVIELELDGQRIIRYPASFSVSLSRPVIAANEMKEIEGFAINNQSQAKLPATFNNLPIFPLETDTVGVNIQNMLTDLDFKIENLRVETRIENTNLNPIEELDISFEVLDWRSIRLNIRLTEQTKKLLGGRRIQFRLCDTKRGNSDWYSINQTFVRWPRISTVKCLNKQCEIIGKGINYIQQISLDDGKTWFPQEPTGLVSKSVENGLESVSVPNLSVGKRSIKVRLRDFPKTEVSY